ncbi:hypothetical protein PI125_g23391 [Phytophthora idaei]|nr:hypothetical protein PI125_g23391 [Phytophthora idaei]
MVSFLKVVRTKAIFRDKKASTTGKAQHASLASSATPVSANPEELE